jgi:rare lipoprotein A
MRSFIIPGLLIGLSLPSQALALSCGPASFYGVGDGFAGRTTANGERMSPGAMTTAHRSLPFGTRLLVTNQSNGRQVTVRVNDRGPYAGGRVLDLSHGSFSKIAPASQGVANICYRRLA